MGELRYKFSESMVRGADMGQVMVKSSILAICSTVFAVPYFHHLVFLSPRMAPLALRLGLRGFLVMELSLLFILCLLCATVGFSFSERRQLPGLGDKTGLIESFPRILLLGAVMTALSYLLFDRFFYRLSPASYPDNLLYLASFPFKAAFTEEVILRAGLVTIAVGIVRNKMAGVVLASAAAALFTLKYFQFIGMGFRLNYIFVTHMILSFLANLVLGYLFVTRGLLYSMALNFLLGMRYAVVSWMI